MKQNLNRSRKAFQVELGSKLISTAGRFLSMWENLTALEKISQVERRARPISTAVDLVSIQPNL